MDSYSFGVGAVVVVGIILIAISMHANVTPTTGTVENQAPQPTEQQKELTEEEKLRNRYIEESNSNTYDNEYFCPNNSNIAECLLRGQHVFTNATLYLYGVEVVSIMPTESNNNFLATIEDSYRGSDSKVQRIAISGTYDDSGNRLVVGDRISVGGKFTGVEMFQQTDGSHVEYGSLKDCKLNSVSEEFTLNDLETIIRSIFGDVNTEVKLAEDDGGAGIKFTRINAELNRIENWVFYQYGNICLSLNGAEHYQVVQFDLDCQHYYVINYDEDYVVCRNITYYDLAGHEIWKKEFEKGCQSYQVAESVIYIYANNEVRILNNYDGTDKMKPVYMPDRNIMFAVEDIIYMFQGKDSTDAIIALDLSGNILWKFSLDSSFTLSNIGRVENELLIESYFYDRSSNDSKTYYRYKRINTKTGQTVSEFKMPDDYN